MVTWNVDLNHLEIVWKVVILKKMYKFKNHFIELYTFIIIFLILICLKYVSVYSIVEKQYLLYYAIT